MYTENNTFLYPMCLVKYTSKGKIAITVSKVPPCIFITDVIAKLAIVHIVYEGSGFFSEDYYTYSVEE